MQPNLEFVISYCIIETHPTTTAGMGNYSSTPETHTDKANTGKGEDFRSVDVDIDADPSVDDEDNSFFTNEDSTHHQEDAFDQDDLVINLVSKGGGRSKKVTKRSVSKSSKKAAKTKSAPSSSTRSTQPSSARSIQPQSRRKSQHWTLAKAVFNNLSDASMDLAEENGFGFFEGTLKLEPTEEGTTYMSRDEIKKDSRVVLALAESLYNNRNLLKKRPRPPQKEAEPEESDEAESSPPARNVRVSKRVRKTPPEVSPLPVTRSQKDASRASVRPKQLEMHPRWTQL